MPLLNSYGNKLWERYRHPTNAYVFDLIDAVIEKLKMGVTARNVVLRFASSGAGGYGAALDPMNTLSEAEVGEKSKLIIEVIDDGAFMKGRHCHCILVGSPCLILRGSRWVSTGR